MKMHRKSILLAMAAGVASLLIPASAHAGLIAWGSAQNITGDTDVSTAGTLFGARNIGDVSVSAATVNGVLFQSLAVPSGSFGGGLGNFTITSINQFSSSNGSYGGGSPFSALSSNYKTLLSAGIEMGFSYPLEIAGLTIGKEYEFEWWANSSSILASDSVATAGASVTLNPGISGELGQFAIGTFTADAATQTITFSGSGILNAFQLRDITAVPEPATAAFGLLCLGAGMIRRRRARAA